VAGNALSALLARETPISGNLANTQALSIPREE
jgi:flagellar basal body rod protein FlgC